MTTKQPNADFDAPEYDEDADRYDIDWDAEFGHDESCDSDEDTDLSVPSVDEISQLLSSISTAPIGEIDTDHKPAESVRADSDEPTESQNPTAIPELDAELREAFMDDAGQCVAAMEDAILSFETNPSDPEPLRLIGRELHTLKGASASVGLEGLAEYLHAVEDSIGSNDVADKPADEIPSAQDLLGHLDHVRGVIAQIQNQGAPQTTSAPTDISLDSIDSPAASAQPSSESFSSDDRSNDDESVRVKSSQLNRLMDMLAELVMLRNRRATELAELQEIYEELVDGVCRVRAGGDHGESGQHVTNISASANQLMATAGRLRECSQPVAEGNEAVSRFIRQFRQELVELRRTPISGLFRRLQRVVRDAANAENKQVKLELVGEDAGIERSLQQRLYEPLLHIVRNCVCHGIEPPQQRLAGGKDACGTITLQAQSSADLFVIEVRDDGQGLNYDAIRRRGIESGLLQSGSSARDQELAQLIFQPGFSTRQSANQVAGRGVGMDVVSDTLKRMRGWIEVDSSAGEGTCIRLSFPLPSVISHTMVFRSSGQLYALPMQFIQNADSNDKQLPSVRVEELTARRNSSVESSQIPAEGQRLVLSCNQLGQSSKNQTGRRVALVVDEIVGPEEVVVRPLPSLLKQHPICSGATLSGLGEIVLVLDSVRVMESVAQQVASRSRTPLDVNSGVQPLAQSSSNKFSAAESPRCR